MQCNDKFTWQWGMGGEGREEENEILKKSIPQLDQGWATSLPKVLKKSRIREGLNLSTDEDHRTNNIFLNLFF